MIRRLEAATSQHQLSVLQRDKFYQIIWITQGTGSFYIDLDIYIIQPNMVFFLMPGQIHFIHNAVDITGFAIMFTASFLRLDVQQYPIFSLLFARPGNQTPVLHLNKSEGALFSQNIQSLEQEFLVAQKGHVAMIQSYMHLLLGIVSRILFQKNSAPLIEITPTLQEFVNLVEAHFREQKQVSDYAKLLSITPDYLNDHVKQRLGKTASEFIRDRVLLEARRQLLYSDTPINEIAHYLGFYHASYFSKFFRRYTGQAPQEFRSETKKQYHQE